MLQRVLRRQHQEGLGQLVGVVADGHLALLHGFEQSRLHLGRRAVDLVREDEVGEYGAFADEELLLLLRVDQRTDQVGRQQVGGELNAREIGIDRLGQRGDGQRFGQPRHAFQQDVPVGEQADQQGVDQVILSDNHLAHFAAQRIDEDAFAFDPFVEFLDVDDFTHFSVCIFDFSLFSVFMQRIPYKIIAKYVFFSKIENPDRSFRPDAGRCPG